ncbi:MAG: Uncharacterized protein FD120_2517 [Gammaproteobacteria bacterium]|nr:MAG: Uncharacterized protein FD120_2517 [Gammaproteobacteria bacterium]
MNPYIFILGLFTLAGLLTTMWGWRIIARARQTLRWPSTEGVIDKSEETSDTSDLLPTIGFSYMVAGQTRGSRLEFPGGITPTPEFTRHYLNKYPAGEKVRVYYDPADPDRTTLEPGLGQGDWLIFVVGLLATFIGAGLLLFGNL